jgi:hypothetical protein
MIKIRNFNFSTLIFLLIVFIWRHFEKVRGSDKISSRFFIQDSDDSLSDVRVSDQQVQVEENIQFGHIDIDGASENGMGIFNNLRILNFNIRVN